RGGPHRRAPRLVHALVIALGIVALATLAANGSRQLRYSAVALLGVSLAANVVTAGQLSVTQLAVEGCGALVACGILYVAARDRTYGEDPGWRLWLATIVAAAATAACFATLRTASSETVTVPLIGEDPSGVTAQGAACPSCRRWRCVCPAQTPKHRGSVFADGDRDRFRPRGRESAGRDGDASRPRAARDRPRPSCVGGDSRHALPTRSGRVARRARVQLLPDGACSRGDFSWRSGPDRAPRHLRGPDARAARARRVVHISGASESLRRGGN